MIEEMNSLWLCLRQTCVCTRTLIKRKKGNGYDANLFAVDFDYDVGV
jgi:hypothetical protein